MNKISTYLKRLFIIAIVAFFYACASESEGQITTADVNDHRFTQLKNMVDTLRLKHSVDQLYGTRHHETGKQHLLEVREFVDQKFKTKGLQVQRQSFDYNGWKGQNIIGRLPGVTNPKEIYIICAHYDTSHNSPGADDNASGIAGVLEVMEVLSSFEFDYTLEFIAFDLEEEGSIGSQYYLEQVESDIEILGVINLDMIGCYSDKPGSQKLPEELAEVFPEAYDVLKANESRADFILNISSTYSEELASTYTEAVIKYVENGKVITLIANPFGEYIPELVGSDNASFWAYDISALHIGEGGATRNEHIDSPRDELDLLNYRFMAQATTGVIITIAEKAGIDFTLTTKANKE